MPTALVFKGKADNISREEARAWIWASLCVLEYHNLHPAVPVLTYHWKKKCVLRGKDDWNGLATRSTGLVELRKGMEPQEAFTTILHETIHLCAEFPDGTEEACTSTLCSRLKPDVAKIAAILLDGTYRRAGAVAHCKISYPPEDGQADFYNDDQHHPVEWEGRYRRQKPNKRKT